MEKENEAAQLSLIVEVRRLIEVGLLGTTEMCLWHWEMARHLSALISEAQEAAMLSTSGKWRQFWLLDEEQIRERAERERQRNRW